MTDLRAWAEKLWDDVIHFRASQEAIESAARQLVDEVIEEYKRDAERYRFLRETPAMKEGVFIAHQWSGAISRWTTDEADRLIDSAIESARKGVDRG